MSVKNLEKTKIIGLPKRRMKRVFVWKLMLFPLTFIGPAIVFPLFDKVNYGRGSDILNTVLMLIYAAVGLYFWNRAVNHNADLINDYCYEVSEYLRTHYGIGTIDRPVWGRTIPILDGRIWDAIAPDGTRIRVKYQVSDDLTDIDVISEHGVKFPKLNQMM